MDQVSRVQVTIGLRWLLEFLDNNFYLNNLFMLNVTGFYINTQVFEIIHYFKTHILHFQVWLFYIYYKF